MREGKRFNERFKISRFFRYRKKDQKNTFDYVKERYTVIKRIYSE